MKNLIIIGSSGHAKLIIDIVEKTRTHRIIGLLDDFRTPGETTMNYQVLGKTFDYRLISQKYPDLDVFVAIGDNGARRKKVNLIKDLDSFASFATLIHPSAQIGRCVKLGEGVALMAGSIVNSGGIIGDHAYINTNSSAGHDIRMGEFSSLAPGVCTGGNISIGKCSAVCIGATVREKVRIGKNCVIGAGSLLLNDCEDNVVMFGSPAQVKRYRNVRDPYILSSIK